MKKGNLYVGTEHLGSLAVVVVLAAAAIGEIGGEVLVRELRERDALSSRSGYIISFVAAEQANEDDPNQGMVFSDCRATWGVDGCFVIKMINHYEHPPVFAKPGTKGYGPIDYDGEGRLVVWRALERYALSSSSRNELAEVYDVLMVDPNGQITAGDRIVMLHRYPPSDVPGWYQFKKYELPMGRGFSRYLGTVTIVEEKGDSMVETGADGTYGKTLHGSWKLTTEGGTDHLVRKATFRLDGETKAFIEVSSSGLVEKSGVKLAKRGVFRAPTVNVEVSLEVEDISRVDGINRVYEEVISMLDGPLPKGSQILDWRGEETVITSVQ